MSHGRVYLWYQQPRLLPAGGSTPGFYRYRHYALWPTSLLYTAGALAAGLTLHQAMTATTRLCGAWTALYLRAPGPEVSRD